MSVLPLWRRSRQRDPLAAVVPGAGGPPREAVVFSGGGSLAAVQVGALRALLEAGVRPDLVVGCSAGALNAAFFAVDPTLDRVAELESVWLGMTRESVFPDRRAVVAHRVVRRAGHLYSPAGLRALIERWVPVADLAETVLPCHVVTTDLLAGRPAWWSAGSTIEVLAASSCLPGVFPPVPLDGSLHVDGGVTCPVPTQRALELGATRVWVLDVSSEFHGRDAEGLTALDVFVESFAISRALLAAAEPVPGAGQRVVRMPALGVGRHDLRNFSRTPGLLAAGLVAGRRMVTAEMSLTDAS